MDKWWARRTGVSVDDLDLREKSGWVGGAIKGVTKLYGALFGWPLILAKYAACAALKPLGMPGLCELINGLTTCKDIIKGAVAEAYQMMGALFFSSNEVLNTLFTGMKQGFESFAGNFLANVTEALKTLMGAEDFDFSVWTRVFAGLLKNPKNIDFSAMLTAVGETLGFNYKTLYEGITASSGLSGALGFILSAAAAVKKFVANKPQEALELIKSLIPAPLTDMFTSLKDDLWGTVVQNLTDFAVGAIPEMITAIAKKIVPGYGWLTIAFDFLKGFVAACQGLGTLFTTFARGVKDASKSSENVVGAIKTSTETALQGVLVPLAVFAITAAGAKNLFQLGRNAFKKLINTGKTILTKVISAIWNPIRGLVQRAGAFFGFNDDALVFSQPATSDGYTVNVSIRGKKQPPGGRAKPLPATGNLEDLVMVSKSPSQPYSELDDDCKKKVTNEWAAVKTAYGKVYGAGPSNDTSADYPALVAAVKALAKAIAKHCSSCRNRQFNHTAKPPGGGSWINYIKTKCGGSEQGVDRPHGHHIVLKGTRFSQSAIAREILCEVGINPYIVNEKLDKRIGCANLIIATNCCHTTAYANATLRELLQVRGNQDGVVSALERLGYDFGRGRWGKERNAANANDECCENKNNG